MNASDMLPAVISATGVQNGGRCATMSAAGCAECHDPGVRFENDWFNFRDPEFSRILRAPLAKGGNGFGEQLCREGKVDGFRRLRIFSTGRSGS